ncbi:MAG: DUF5686 family protein [Flavobacteriaceae bacterium]|jgi:hypothetical protein|nr:DUF5686 family protein [Flavobacteriaceae bacterium]
MIKNFKIFFTIFFFAAISGEAQQTTDVSEVVIQGQAKKFKKKKENPAFAIMQQVWKHKRQNGIEKYKNYQYEEYEKIEFILGNIDSAFMKKKIFNKMDFIFDYADSAANGKLELPLFLNEAVYKTTGQNSPTKRIKKEAVANKSSGFEDNEIVGITAKELYKEIDIYDNTLNFFNIGFPSPLSSTEGFSNYDYNLIDTVSVRGEPCFHIKYFPKRTEQLAFTGDLFISAEKYAVVKASLRSTKKMNVNFVNGIFTELEFEAPDDETFLPLKNTTEINMSILRKNRDEKGLIGKRTVSYGKYLFDQNLDEKIFEPKETEELKNLKKPDEYWEKSRSDSLTTHEAGIYEMVDLLQQNPKFKKISKIYEVLESGYYNVGHAIDIGDLYSTFGFNEVEGTRLRMGARTYFSQNDTWRIQGYGAFGFRDNQFKYGVEAKAMFNKNNRFMMGFGTRRDILQLGVQLTTDNGIMSRTFASSSIISRGTNALLSSVNQSNFFVSIEPWKNFQIRLDGTQQSIKSANPKSFNTDFYYHNELRHTLLDTHFTLSLMARPKAKFAQTGIDRYEHSSLAPTFILQYTRGLEGLFNADFNYNKLQFLYFQPILLGSWGKTLLNFEAGKTFEAVPLSIQNVIPGNQSYSLVPNTFSQLNYYEFVADSYAILNLEQHFNGKILSYIPLIKKLKFRELAFIRGAYGTLSDNSKNINVEGNRFSAPSSQIYYEYGFGIENIGFGNLRILRVDFNWRGNYLQNPDVSKFGVKAGFQFNF